jgi:hypothetical protein
MVILKLKTNLRIAGVNSVLIALLFGLVSLNNAKPKSDLRYCK